MREAFPEFGSFIKRAEIEGSLIRQSPPVTLAMRGTPDGAKSASGLSENSSRDRLRGAVRVQRVLAKDGTLPATHRKLQARLAQANRRLDSMNRSPRRVAPS